MRGEEEQRILAAHEALVAAGVIEPLSRDPDETRRWLDCELSSLVENRFFAGVDPMAMGPEERAAWEPRASSDEPLSDPHNHAWYRRVYWLLDGGERAGTIALATTYMGIGLVTVSSLYTVPSRRRRGLAANALRRAHEAVIAHGGRGLRVPAYWTWQPAVRFYLSLGMRVLNWKHAIVFSWQKGTPAHRLDVGEHSASFSIETAGGEAPLIVAARDGDRLGWSELPALREGPNVHLHARETLAVAIATRGYPLLRSREAWDERFGSLDAGFPEGLAHKILLWEEADREQGYELRTPRIPGLPHAADGAA